MAEGDAGVYNRFKKGLVDGDVDLENDTIKVILVDTHTPNADDNQYGTISDDEYSSHLGYTKGGATLGSQTTSQDNTNDQAEFDASDLTWSSLGPLSQGGDATPSHAIMYDDTHASDILLMYWVLGTTATNGGDYTLQWGAPLMTLS